MSSSSDSRSRPEVVLKAMSKPGTGSVTRSRSRSRSGLGTRSRSRSQSRSPPGPKAPLTAAQFEKEVGDLEIAGEYNAYDVNSSLIKQYSHYFKKMDKDEEEKFKDEITNEDIKNLRKKFQKLNDKGNPVAFSTYKNIEKAPYNWQKLVIEATKLLKDDVDEISLDFDRYTWDAGLLVIYAGYPKYLKEWHQGYVDFKHLKPI
jgi:hypothetical protein